MIPFIRVKGSKVSSALKQSGGTPVLRQNACLNFWTLYSNEGLILISTADLKIQTRT